jgi:hypothetical protein
MHIQGMFPKLRLLEETKGGGKEEKNVKYNLVGVSQTTHTENELYMGGRKW